MNTIVPGVTKNRGSVLFDNKGELNASSKKEAISRLNDLITMCANSDFEDKATIEANAEARRERGKALVEAMADKSGNKMTMLAEAITTEILDQTNREGFARRFMQFKTLDQGDMPYVTLRDKQVLAYQMSSASRVIPTEIRERRQLLNEFSITAEVLITNMEISRSPNDLLEEKYDEGLEALMVVEDRYWKQLADRAATTYNVQSFLQFSPSILARMLNILATSGLPVGSMLISTNVWQDFIAGSEFVNVFDPVTRWDIIQTGELGQMYGVQILSDAQRGPNLRVLEPGDIYIVSTPEYHGVMHARPLTTEAINQYNQGQAKRGWFFEQITSMMIGNARSVIRGKRLFN